MIQSAHVDYAEIDTDGHLCLIGTNGAGKTTLLRLALFFYTADQRRLGISKAKESFESYYFHSPNSYIIYEVQGEHKFHVLVHKQQKIQFYFIDEEYKKEFYFDDTRIKNIHEIFATLDLEGVAYSKKAIEQFSLYRSIIYGSSGEKRYAKYGLLKGNAYHKNLSRAIGDIFMSSSSEISSEFIKNFVAETVADNNINVDLGRVKHQLEEFTEKYEDIKMFRSQFVQQSFKEILRLREEIIQGIHYTEEILHKLFAKSNYNQARYSVIESETTELDRKIEEAQHLIQNLETENREKREALKQELGKAESLLEKALQKEKEFSNIDKLLSIKEEVPFKTQQLENVKEELKILKVGHSDIEGTYKDLIKQVDHEIAESQKLFEEQLRQVELNKREALQELKENNTEKRTEASVALLDRLEVLKDQVREKDQVLYELRIQLKNLSTEQFKMDEFLELRRIKSTLSKETDHLRQRHQTWQQKHQNLTFKKEKNDDQHQRSKETLEQGFTRQLEKLMAKKEGLEKKINQYGKSLYGFLHESRPNWNETFGRLLDEEMLLRDDLKPVLKNNDNTVFGVELDMKHLPPRVRNQEEMSRDLQLLVKEMQDVKETHLKEQTELLEKYNQQNKILSSEAKQLREEELLLQNDRERFEENKREAEKREEKLFVERQELYVKEKEQFESKIKLIDKDKKVYDEEVNLLQNQVKSINEEYRFVFEDAQKEANARFDRQTELLQNEKKSQREELLVKKATLNEEQKNSLKTGGVDISKIKELEEKEADLTQFFLDWDSKKIRIALYQEAEKEYIRHIDDYKKNIESAGVELTRLESDFENKVVEVKAQHKIYSSKKSANKEEFQKIKSELEIWTQFQEDNHLYVRYKQKYGDLEGYNHDETLNYFSSRINKTEREQGKRYDQYYGLIRSTAGKFRPDNIFDLSHQVAGEIEQHTEQGKRTFERFANQVYDLLNSDAIEIKQIEVARAHNMVINDISAYMRDLIDRRGKINKIVDKMVDDFAQTDFTKTGLIENIELRIVDTENLIVKQLKKIKEFSELHVYQMGETNLFTGTQEAKKSVDKQSIDLLDKLLRLVDEEQKDEIRLQDLFELEFRIKEGKNDTGWIRRISDVGSTGTDVLVKAMIYITLLNVFMRESAAKAKSPFVLHCIIDEVGQIAAPYLRALLEFAEARNIRLINGLPNESKLETHYNYTFKLAKHQGKVKVHRLLKMVKKSKVIA